VARTKKPKKTPSPGKGKPPWPAVAEYMTERGYAIPEFGPKFLTPEPTGPGVRFEASRVDRVIKSMRVLKHTQGEWAGKPLEPDAWQVAYVLGPIFGYVKTNAAGRTVRVCRKAFVDLPRKNGKTTLSGGVATYLTGADGEAGAQVYAVATKKDQARYCFDPVKQIVQHSPVASKHFKPYQNRITHPASGSYFSVVSSIGEALHGANVHGAVIDEVHLHKTPDLIEAIETGTGARLQPLIFMITTADDGKPNTVYAHKRLLVEQLARGALVDPATFGVVFGVEETDDPFVEETWQRANPGYGISPTKEFMETQATAAKNSPAELASFQRLHLGIRTKQTTRFIKLDDWDRCKKKFTEKEIFESGFEVFGGLDLASTSDLCALCWMTTVDGKTYATWRLWTPEANLRSLDKRTAGAASVWVNEGLLTLTPGNVADYAFIYKQITEDMDRFQVQALAYDPWNSSQLVTDLVEYGAPMIPMRQGYASVSAPTKELQRAVLSREIVHDGNAAVRWQVDNLSVQLDPAGNVKPDKSTAIDKIDAVVAMIMAFDQFMRNSNDESSVYDDRDFITL
jgi:phage terminase large subunit-like protein